MRNNTEGLLDYIAVLKAEALQMTFTMQVGLIVMAVLMILLLLGFVGVVVFTCKRKKKSQCSEWVSSASIEHLRFDPSDIEAQRVRTSTPHSYAEMSSFDEIFHIHNNNRGVFYDQVANYTEPVLTTAEMEVINNKSKTLLKTFPQTFSTANEPKYIYWETRV